MAGCRCGRLHYELRGELGFTFHCHCPFCRRIHGSAFTTVSIEPRASPVCNHPREPKLLCLVVASLDDDRDVAPWAHLNTESKAPWFEFADALPQFAAFPNPEEIAALTRKHRGASR